MNDQQKHLEFIQSVIVRLSSNSFQIKSWAVTIVAATLAVYATTQAEEVVLVGVFSSIVFGVVDAYCLSQEKRYRGLYNDVARMPGSNRIVDKFDMDASFYAKGKNSFWSTLLNKTIIMYTLIITFLLLTYYIL